MASTDPYPFATMPRYPAPNEWEPYSHRGQQIMGSFRVDMNEAAVRLYIRNIADHLHSRISGLVGSPISAELHYTVRTLVHEANAEIAKVVPPRFPSCRLEVEVVDGSIRVGLVPEDDTGLLTNILGDEEVRMSAPKSISVTDTTSNLAPRRLVILD